MHELLVGVTQSERVAFGREFEMRLQRQHVLLIIIKRFVIFNI